MYGDNIYHTSFATGEIVQEYSHHSYPDGGTNLLNYNRDVPGENVLISNNYWYWGREAIKIPSQLLKLAAVKRGHRVFENAAFVSEVPEEFPPQAASTIEAAIRIPSVFFIFIVFPPLFNHSISGKEKSAG